MAKKQPDVKKSRLQERAERASMHDFTMLGIQTGDDIKSTPAYCMKIEGERGAGKTTFLLDEVTKAARKYGQERVLCCIIDMDNGARRLFNREDIVPEQYKGCFMRKVVSHFEDVYNFLQIFVDILTEHYLKYPTDSARFLVLENEGQFWLSCRDHYAEDVHNMPERELMQARMAQAKSEMKYNPTSGKMESKKMLPTFAEGRRAAYTVINRNYMDFFISALALADELNCNFIYTTLAEKKQVFQNDQATDKWVLSVSGKPGKSDGYPDFILQLFVDENGGKNKEDVFMMKCTKNRDGPRFKMENHGPELFWDFVSKAREDIVAKNLKKKGLLPSPKKKPKATTTKPKKAKAEKKTTPKKAPSDEVSDDDDFDIEF